VPWRFLQELLFLPEWEFINDAFIEYLNFDKSFCVFPRRLYRRFRSPGFSIRSMCHLPCLHQTRHFKFNHDELFF
jgi:hypothetical protein